MNTYLQALATKLNSNQAFEPDDSFTVETIFISTPGPGSSHGKRYKPSSAAARGIAKCLRVTIKNSNALCCALAIVTMKAYVDGGEDGRDREYRNLKEGYPIQEKKAKELQSGRSSRRTLWYSRAKNVSRGASIVPAQSPFCHTPHMLIYKGPTPSNKIIRILKDGAHYD